MDTTKLAENKLLLLYILQVIDFPISETHLSRIILENDLIDYFTLQENISFLMENKFIKKTSDKFMEKYALTSEGSNILKLFEGHINFIKKEILDDYIFENISRIKSDMSINSKITKCSDNSFLVNLNIVESDCAILDLTINVPSREYANNITKKWNENPSKTYLDIYDLLVIKNK